MSDIFTRDEMFTRAEAIYAKKLSVAESNAALLQLHRDYYGAYVRTFNVIAPQRLIGICREALKAGDPHMNSPYTQLVDWDMREPDTRKIPGLVAACRANGEGWSLSTNICLLKEAARQQIEQEGE